MSTPASELFHHRWAVPVLAELHRSAGSRVAALTGRLGVSRQSLRQTLAALVESGLVRRNPGYGHPLRPEYLLTAKGRRVGGHCAALLEALSRLESIDVGLKKWSMPTILALADGVHRFSELRSSLHGITPRALTLTLKDLDAAGLIRRRVTDQYPPATLYRLTQRGRALTPILERLAA